jgi:fructan beta-fructosidase
VPIREPHGELELRLLVDTSSVEVFVNDGEAVLTSLVLPQLKSHGFRLTGDPDIRMETLEFWPLQSIWK